MRSERIINEHAKAIANLGLGILMVALVSAAVPSFGQAAHDCAPLNDGLRSRILHLAARSMGTDPILPIVEHEGLLEGTCYTQMSVVLPHKKGHGVLYVSPDRRFVTPVLWDLSADFEKQDAKMADQLLSQAVSDHAPSLGPDAARVTIIIFSDFQCPFCAAFSRMVEQYQDENPGRLRLIFRNNPMPMHKWAQDAARAGVCIAEQSGDAFWKFQDFLFANQKQITSDNLGERVNGFLHSDSRVQADKYLECITTPRSQMRLDQDLKEADSLHIQATPTLFINGRRHGGFASEEDFAAVIDAIVRSEGAGRGE